jgi:hypothetical protein
MLSALFWVIMQSIVAIITDVSGNLLAPSSRLKNPEKSFFWDSELLNLGPIGFPETSVSNYYYTLSNIPDERRSRRKPEIEFLFFVSVFHKYV